MARFASRDYLSDEKMRLIHFREWWLLHSLDYNLHKHSFIWIQLWT